MSLNHLIEAVIRDDTSEVRKLLESGVNPNAYDHETKLFPIHFAALYNALHVVPLLAKAGANIDIKSDEGITPLEIARQYDYKEMTSLLKKR